MEPDSPLLLCQNATKQNWQGKKSPSYSVYVHVSMCVSTCVCITGKQKLVNYCASSIKRIYPQVLNLLFHKLSGENKCLYLIT